MWRPSAAIVTPQDVDVDPRLLSERRLRRQGRTCRLGTVTLGLLFACQLLGIVAFWGQSMRVAVADGGSRVGGDPDAADSVGRRAATRGATVRKGRRRGGDRASTGQPTRGVAGDPRAAREQIRPSALDAEVEMEEPRIVSMPSPAPAPPSVSPTLSLLRPAPVGLIVGLKREALLADSVSHQTPLAFAHGRCLEKVRGYWTFEVCIGQEVRQFHSMAHGAGRHSVINLGHHKVRVTAPLPCRTNRRPCTHVCSLSFCLALGEQADLDGLASHSYLDGTACDSHFSWHGESRQSTVDFACGTADRITSVDEPSPCHYRLVVELRSLCGERYDAT